MTFPLPINIDSLLRGGTIESERVEYKAGWNPERVLHTLAASWEVAMSYSVWRNGTVALYCLRQAWMRIPSTAYRRTCSTWVIPRFSLSTIP